MNTMMMLRSWLCKLSIIQHLTYSPLSQRTYRNSVLISNGWNSSKRFLRCSSWVLILKSGLNENFHFFVTVINFSLTGPISSLLFDEWKFCFYLFTEPQITGSARDCAGQKSWVCPQSSQPLLYTLSPTYWNANLGAISKGFCRCNFLLLFSC